MKKILIMSLMLLPMVADAAPAVKLLGNNSPSVAGTKTVVPAKVTPARAAALAKTGNMARVGTLRAKSATTAIDAGSTARFPVIIPTKVYTTGNSPKTTGGVTTVVPADTSAIEGRVRALETQVANHNATIVNHNTAIASHSTTINNHEEVINRLDDDPRFDSVVVGESNLRASSRTLQPHRAWMWVEIPE